MTPAAPASVPRPTPGDFGLLAVLIVLWGSAYGMTFVAVEAVPPAVLVCLRLWVGAMVLGLGVRVIGAPLPRLGDARAWGVLALIGACGTLLPFLLISFAQTRVPSALAAVFIAAAPLAVAVLSHVFVPGERLNWRRAAGLVVGFAGVCLLFAPALIEGGVGAASLSDQGLLLLAAVLYGATSVIVRLTGPAMHPVVMAFGYVGFAALMSVPPAVLAWPAGGLPVEALHVAAILGLGIGSTGVANFVYVQAIRRVGPVFMSNVGNLAPFWSLLIGAVFLNEALPSTLYAALAVILLGVWLVQRRGGPEPDRTP